MRMQIGKVKYENFKCFKSFEADFRYRNALVKAANGKGKTALADGVDWGLYDKASDGRKKFGIRPVDRNPDSPHYGEAIPSLVVAVEIPLRIDGTVQTFRKEQHEKTDKGGKLSYPNKYWIDGYAMPEGKYKQAIANIIPEDKLKMLIDPDYFNNDKKYSRPERRETLVDMAGKIGTPAGFDTLLERLNGHKAADEKKRLRDSRTLFEEEQHDNKVCIGEKQRQLDEYVQAPGQAELESKRNGIKEKIADLGKQRTELLGKEKERAALNEKANDLTSQLSKRESEIKNDTSGQQTLLDEKAKLELEHANKTQALVILQSQIQSANTNIESLQNDIDKSQETLKFIRAEYKIADKTPTADTCYACGQSLPADKLADNMNKKQTALAAITERSEKFRLAVKERKQQLTVQQGKLSELIKDRTDLTADLKTAEQAKNTRIAKINEAIKNRPESNPADDKDWQELTAEIEKVKAQIGEPVSVQLEKIEARKQTAEAELEAINKTLNAADEIKKAGDRITDLEIRQKEIAQLIADINGQLDELGRYQVAQSRMVEAQVNGMFEHITFRLFGFFQNGDVDDSVCVAVLDGVPYPDMSAGQQIYCGIDCINTLSDYYGVELPMFIDHDESISLPIEAKSQVIELRMERGVKELQITLEAEQADESEAKVA